MPRRRYWPDRVFHSAAFSGFCHFSYIVASLFAGAGQVAALTSLNVSMQLRSPDEILGRCLSIFQALTFGGFAVGSWAWGALSDAAGLASSLFAAATWMVVAMVALRFLAPMPEIGEGTVEAS